MSKTLEELDERWKTFWSFYRKEFEQLAVLEAKIDYSFQKNELLYEAMVHRSAIKTAMSEKLKDTTLSIPWNERLEFLGDSVLGLVIASLLWERQASDEGQLSKRKAALVSEASLAKLAKQLGIQHCLTLGYVEKKMGSHLRPSLLADALEALIGAMYLDSSFDTVCERVQEWFLRYFPVDDCVFDAKTRLQELFQEHFQRPPEYLTLEERGPDHAKTFRVALQFDGRTLAEAESSSKKRASQAAAKMLLEAWEQEGPLELSKNCQLLGATKIYDLMIRKEKA